MRALVLLAGMAVFQPCLGETLQPQDHAAPPAQVRIALQWIPQSQFAGFYLAQQQGFYAAAGAEVTFVHANARRSSLEHLQDGEAELATVFLTDAMVAAAGAHDSPNAAHPVLIGQLVQRSNLMLLAWKDQGIEHLQDLSGHRISLWTGPFSAAIRTLLAERQIEYEPIPQNATVNLFLHGGVAACAAMEYNEYHRIWQAGVDEDRLTGFLLRDLGFDFPEDGLYARSDWLQHNHALAQRLWQATLAGWEYARAHPEQAVDLVLAEAERARVLTNRPHERWMLEHLLASIFPETAGESPTAGRLSPAAYTATAQALIASGLISEALPLTRFCPDCCAEDGPDEPC
ncbi:ABC transporter substrate-binding protein [Ectothiorhodospira lacustris]|uniref:ABC transporter substrate-binding protein n=1 Tax=Ectothiorhodospira lacustris TaxID=2899127 RepID=UPI001EE9590F|nr:ABC transporter substrate-binding protein [Ectothiorhodospira lacustris]MCG5511449.1 ABC transporter substrate-binding protein [Ectothiorhodospira lacustris]MCG5523235.1 ABC transporter substrate-binding protein [Ectothiorhodospira lacustris]